MPPPKLICDCFHKNERKFRKGLELAKQKSIFFKKKIILLIKMQNQNTF